MTTPFAALEARVSASVFAHLANASADFGGGVVVDGLFDVANASAFDLVGGVEITFQAPTVQLSGVLEGAAVSIDAVTYTVKETLHAGRGVTMLTLART